MAANEVAEEALDTRLKIRAERMELLFQQSFRAAYMGMVMSIAPEVHRRLAPTECLPSIF